MRGIFNSILVVVAVVALIAPATLSGQPDRPPRHDAPHEPPPEESGDGRNGDSDPGTSRATEPERVILQVNRNLEVAGHVELEDDEVIVIRTLQGRIESHLKSRILRIVRLVTPEPGQRGVVIMRNGQRRKGVIIEDAFDHVSLEVEGIRTRISREFVDSVILEPTFQEQYQRLKASIGPGMDERHLMLCRWLIEQRRYELARENLLELIDDVDPRLAGDAQRLLRIVEAQLRLMRQPESPSSEEAVEGDATDDPADNGFDFDPGRLLTREEVNLIRVYEIDFDHPPKLRVPSETVQAMISNYSSSPLIPTTTDERDALLTADPTYLVRLMFELRARELYPQVQVLSEPYGLNLFRQRVHNTWLLNHCATSGCHGGPNAGRLFLHREGYKDERVRYTNLLILERLEVDSQWPLINYNEPEMSLIIQYALPRAEARLPHPDVPRWRPVFSRTNERLGRESLRWIRSMMTPRPGYPIDYTPPDPVAQRAAQAAANAGGDGAPATGADSPAAADDAEK